MGCVPYIRSPFHYELPVLILKMHNLTGYATKAELALSLNNAVSSELRHFIWMHF